MNESFTRHRPAPRRASRTLTGDRGSVTLTITFGMVAILAFAVLTIDIGMIMLTRYQLQNAADAAALAGASGLWDGSQADAEERAITIAGLNDAWQDGMQPVVIAPADVTFPTATRCRVRTHRTTQTGDALTTFFIRVIAPAEDRLADVTAVAEAEYYRICGTDCVKPWMIPDRWDDVNQNGEYDDREDFTDLNGNDDWDPGEPYDDANQNGVWDPEEPYDPVATGYLPPADIGQQMALKVGGPQDAIVPSFFFAVNFPPINDPQGPPESGANTYRWNIANCSPYVISIGDRLQIEPGNMKGPTKSGCNELIAMDPDAYWDGSTSTVEGSAFGTSPREIVMAFFDPVSPLRSGRTEVTVVKMAALFLEGVDNQGTVTGRFMDLAAGGEECPPGAPGFLFSSRLTQ